MGDNFNSWSIPKRKPPPQQDPPPRSMDTSIPRRKPPPPQDDRRPSSLSSGGGGPPIPRQRSTSSYDAPPPRRPPSYDDERRRPSYDDPPRRQSSHGAASYSDDRRRQSSYDEPRRSTSDSHHRSSYDESRRNSNHGRGYAEPPRRGSAFNDEPRRSRGYDYDDEPPRRSSVYGDEPRRSRGYDDEPPRRGGYEDEPPRRSSVYDDEPRRRGYDDELPRRSSIYEDEPPRRSRGYDDEPPRRGGYDDEPRRGGGYDDEPRRSSFNDESRRGYSDGSRLGGYNDEPPLRRIDDSRRGYNDEARRGGGYDDEPPRRTSLDRGYSDVSAARRGYNEEPARRTNLDRGYTNEHLKRPVSSDEPRRSSLMDESRGRSLDSSSRSQGSPHEVPRRSSSIDNEAGELKIPRKSHEELRRRSSSNNEAGELGIPRKPHDEPGHIGNEAGELRIPRKSHDEPRRSSIDSSSGELKIPRKKSLPSIDKTSGEIKISRSQVSSREEPRHSSIDSASGELKIPRKKSLPTTSKPKPAPKPSAVSSPREQPRRSIGVGVSIISEYPFKIRIPLRGVPLHEGGLPRFRASIRTPKRERPSYQELDDTDSDFLADSDEEKIKIVKKKKKMAQPALLPDASVTAVAAVDKVSADSALPGLLSAGLEGPPEGELNTLWYSREVFLEVFALEKILAWKTRIVNQIEWIPETLPEDGPPTDRPHISPADAKKWSNLALTNPLIWTDPGRRMEVSRIAPQECPIVMVMGAEAEKLKESGPKFRMKPVVETYKEEVFLVKWRGRSHLHASWERGSDIIKYDQSNNTARNKIRRFVQSQEILLGFKWKEVLEDERATAASIHAHGEHGSQVDADVAEEEYYPPGTTEVERILLCDESEMDLSLFAKQRALNAIREQELVQRRDNGTTIKWRSEEGLKDLLTELPWDPEDNVRYIVKWKGLPFAEMTWEYWRDIKRDAVTEAEDFWIRQKPPNQATIERCIRHQHPHMRDFRKIQESPVYGISKIDRPVADLGQTMEAAKDDDEDVPIDSGLRLRSYQLEGVNWLLFNWWNKRSCILADEMGLGKTIQSMAFIKTLQELPSTGVRGPYLIVAPLSLIGQWQAEAKTWAPDLNVVLYHGSADARDFLVKHDFYYIDQFVPKPTAKLLKKNHITKFDILITTYEVVLKDVHVMSKIRWRTLIVDEAHRLKNPKSRLFADLSTVPRDYCILLTGTPLANATEELWALLHFADRQTFADKDEFLEKFGQLTDAEQVEQLHSVLKPYLLRRVKEDVEKSLPPKEETILEVSLTPAQKQFYKAIYERNTSFLFKGSKPSNAPSLMNVMMELRKCCNHPFLVRGAEERILAESADQIRGTKDSNGNPILLDHSKNFFDQLIKSSGKMVLINKLLPKLFANGHKVLIFSQMVRVLDLLEELIKMMKYKYERLDGSTSSSSRAAAVDRFVRKSCKRFVMLLSTRAGGLGLNLTAADVVIIFDSDWNPQNDLQAMARAHRIGQTRSVQVYRLLTAKTYEMHMFHSASMKLGLEKAVLSHQRDSESAGEGKSKSKSEKEAQAKEIDSLLKKGAYDVFRDDDDEEAKKFMDTDIDQLLERNTSTVTYGSTQNNMSSGLGSFSKASFVTDTGDGEKDVDLDDPDFWKKAVGLDAPPEEVPEEVKQMLDDGVKRSRKQVQQFDPYADFAERERRKEEEEKERLREEKEEKERLRAAKKKRKREEKQRKEKERQEREKLRGSLLNKSSTPPPPPAKAAKNEAAEDKREIVKIKKQPKEVKIKKPKQKNQEKQRAMRRARNEDPGFERLKQAWEVPQRNRSIAACLRYGFMRFCKIRNESNLTSLPIQDLEVFFRAYFFQLSLQVVVSFLQLLQQQEKSNDGDIKTLLVEYLGPTCRKEVDWLCNCFCSGMRHYGEVEAQRLDLRIPLTLSEPEFMDEMRKGKALRALRRIFMLSRIQRIIEDCLDEILSELGHEELGKRGCQTSNISAMDSDLKSRLVTAEELSLGLSAHIGKIRHRPPVAWWDRSCDIFLLIGSFVHGLGNYEAMLHDDTLPFAFKIRRFSKKDVACIAAQEKFTKTTEAARKVFDDALEATKLKAQEEVQAAVARASADAAKREKNALAMREGGAAADAVFSTIVEDEPAESITEFKEDDPRFITLRRLKKALNDVASSPGELSFDKSSSTIPSVVASAEAASISEDAASKRRSTFHTALSMPDARILDQRLSMLLSEVEGNAYPDEASEVEMSNAMSSKDLLWPSSKVVSVNSETRTSALLRVLAWTTNEVEEAIGEFTGIGTSGAQCGSVHKSLDDGSDFSMGTASVDLAQVAYGPDSPRYLRAIGVPMSLTRYALSALVHADDIMVDRLLDGERVRFSEDSKLEDNAVTMEVEGGKTEVALKTETTAEAEATIKTEPTAEAEPMVKTEQVPTPTVEAEVTEKPEDPSTTDDGGKVSIPKVFEENNKLRAGICAVVLHYGFPVEVAGDSKIYRSLWNSVQTQCGNISDSEPPNMFNADRFMALAKEFSGLPDLPNFSVVKEYVTQHLLPHCLRLCVMGNGPTTVSARGSKVCKDENYRTAHGTSLYPEHAQALQSPLPDPCLEVGEHSVEALAASSAIIRRVRLMKAAVGISSGKLSLDQLNEILHSSFLRKSMEGLPVWWCPWIHDAAFLMHASSRGLFSILRDRTSSEHVPLAFSPGKIKSQMHSTFVADENVIPHTIVNQSQSDDSQTWIDEHSKMFPTPNVLERRLSFLCSKASEALGIDSQYSSLPMFDHGGWPRN